MTKFNPIPNIDVTIKEIFDEYTSASVQLLWESRNDDCQNIDTLAHDFRRDISGLLTPSLQRQNIRRMFAEGYTMMMIPSKKFDIIDDASANSSDFTISIFNDDSKLISVLTTEEVSW